jgi:hypothetical protein
MHSDGSQNYFVATDRPEPVSVRPPELDRIHPGLRAEAEAVFARVVRTPPNHGRVLTDDFNPAEFYDAQNREATRRNQVERVRRMGGGNRRKNRLLVWSILEAVSKLKATR